MNLDCLHWKFGYIDRILYNDHHKLRAFYHVHYLLHLMCVFHYNSNEFFSTNTLNSAGKPLLLLSGKMRINLKLSAKTYTGLFIALAHVAIVYVPIYNVK